VMRVTMTFDNGPDRAVTPYVLDVLGAHDIRAIFFVVGSKLDVEGQQLAWRAQRAGHRLGNHTFTHSTPFGERRQPGESRLEIERTQDAMGELADPDRLFRPVGGGVGGIIDRRLLNREALETLTVGGYTLALWNVVPRDWLDPDGWARTALARISALEHAVVVVHDTQGAAMEQLSEFLDRALDLGAEFSTQVPHSVTPILRGEIVGPISHLMPEDVHLRTVDMKKGP